MGEFFNIFIVSVHSGT